MIYSRPAGRVFIQDSYIVKDTQSKRIQTYEHKNAAEESNRSSAVVVE